MADIARFELRRLMDASVDSSRESAESSRRKRFRAFYVLMEGCERSRPLLLRIAELWWPTVLTPSGRLKWV